LPPATPALVTQNSCQSHRPTPSGEINLRQTAGYRRFTLAICFLIDILYASKLRANLDGREKNLEKLCHVRLTGHIGTDTIIFIGDGRHYLYILCMLPPWLKWQPYTYV